MSLCWPYQSVSIALSFAMRRSSTQGRSHKSHSNYLSAISDLWLGRWPGGLTGICQRAQSSTSFRT